LSHTFVAVFFLNAASPTMIYTLSLHDALPILELLINNPDSVFVIEDAENIVIDRNLQNGSPVSGLLNLADGLLADCLNIQLICTDRKSTRLNSSHVKISYAVFCLKKKQTKHRQ